MYPWVRQQAAKAVFAGGVIACPTEAVWGLSCNPFDHGAVEKILRLKRRSVDKGLIVVAASAEQLSFLLTGLDQKLSRPMLESWPGPHTWLVPHHRRIPYWVSGDSDKVAVRVTAHPLLSELCKITGPLVSTSANPAGLLPAKTISEARRYFAGKVDYYLPGKTSGALAPSSITDLITGNTLR